MNVDGFNIIIGVAGVLVAIGGVLAATLPGRTLRKGQTAREAFALVRDLEEFDQRAAARLEGAEFERDASTRTNRAQLLESVRAAALISAHDFAESAKRAGVPYSFSVFLFVYGGSICAVARLNSQIPPPPTSGPLSRFGDSLPTTHRARPSRWGSSFWQSGSPCLLTDCCGEQG